jgi:hypothetical protein
VFGKIRAAVLTLTSTAALLSAVAPAAHANLLSLLPGSCGNQPESQPFYRFGDGSFYTPVAGGSFEAGSPKWLLSRGAQTAAGNETFNVAGSGSQSLSLPAGSSALSLPSCTSIYHATVRFFMRNTGDSHSRLTVQAVYPTLLGVATTTLGQVSGSSSWAPSQPFGLLLNNLLATVSLNQTVIAFRFVPADNTGHWSIDDVYLDPYARR